MKIFSYFLLCLFLPFFVAKCNGQDCSLIQRIFDDAKRISTSQRDIDQIIFDNGLVSTFSDDPTWITFGEYPVDSIFVKQMQQSQDLLNFLRLLQERFPDSWQNLTSCISATDRCPQRPEYTCGRERSLDGTCNNLQQPTMGASYTSYTRMFSSYFVDGIDNVRRSKFLNNELPSPRHISNEIYAEQERRAARKLFPFVGSTQEENICNGKPSYSQPINSPWKYQPRQYTFSFLGYMFGQLIAVDTANRIITKGPDRTAPSLQCCRNPVASRNGMGREIANPACLPLIYPANDPFFSRFNVTCGNFVRAATLIPFDCSLKTAEYGNSPTSYADLSGIYGIDQLTLDGLRERKGGRLLTNEHNVLPLDPNSPPQAPYGAGDFRLNQSPVLALWHSLIYRHHNFICEYLESQNPTWNDDELFNACRRLNIAIYQHILFNEYLPLFLKEDYSSRFGIRCDRTKSPDCDKYRSDIDSAIIIEFTQAAGRGLHACSPDSVYMVSEDRKIEQKIPFSDTLGVTNVLDHQYNSILRGAICQPIQCTNISYSNEIRNRMFKLNANGPGFDLFSIDINRARENGLPPYHELFTKCTGIKVRSWNDLLRHFDVENVALMARIYESVFDMDTLAGVLMERRDFSLMGVVARCMTAEQFRNIKYGDRYFYSFSDSPTKFSKAQINEIERMSIAKLLCQVTDLESVPQHAFLVESAQNPNILCKTYRDFDFSLWKGTPA